MKSFRTLVVVGQPVERVWGAVRDRMAEIAPMLDEVEAVTVLERREEEGRVHLLNEWRARVPAPAVTSSILPGGVFRWLDRAEWIEAELRCDWSIEPRDLEDLLSCTGRTTYCGAMGGRGARVTFEGTLEIDLRRIVALGRPLENAASALVESIVSTIIPRNFTKTVHAACRLLERPPEGSPQPIR
jgi:hypothetical protein